MNVRDVGFCLSPRAATAAFFVLMAMFHVRPFNWRGRLIQAARVVAPISEQEAASIRDVAFFS
jgi:hypothetical protein